MRDIQAVALLKKDLSDPERIQFDLQMMTYRKSPTTALLLSLFLGYLGVDRFYIGDTVIAAAKMLTLGGFLVWAFIDLFFIASAARTKNLLIAKEVHDSLVSLRA